MKLVRRLTVLVEGGADYGKLQSSGSDKEGSQSSGEEEPSPEGKGGQAGPR